MLPLVPATISNRRDELVLLTVLLLFLVPLVGAHLYLTRKHWRIRRLRWTFVLRFLSWFLMIAAPLPMLVLGESRRPDWLHYFVFFPFLLYTVIYLFAPRQLTPSEEAQLDRIHQEIDQEALGGPPPR